MAGDKLGYAPLRQLMAARERDREGVSIDPDRIMLTNGSMQAITLLAETLCEGVDDVVVMEEYNYSGTIAAYNALGRLQAIDGDIAGAVRMFERAIEIDPAYVPALQNAARMYRLALHDEKRAAHYERLAIQSMKARQ